MGQQLRSEQISIRLLLLMSIIILSVLLIAIPQIISSYQQYRISHQAVLDIQTLRVFAETSNKISRERAPTNKAMSSTTLEAQKNINELNKYRSEVDQQIDITVKTLNRAGFTELAKRVDQQLKYDLGNARKHVDAYLALSKEKRTVQQMDQAILGMFGAWDSCRTLLQQLVMDSKKRNKEVTDYASMVLILADLRDQAGRVASNIMAPLSFSASFPEKNKLRSLQTQEQVKYLWQLLDTIQPESLKTQDYLNLHQQVKDRFIDQGLSIVVKLLQESDLHQPYSITANQLTDAMVGKFTTVVDLQTYLLEMQSLDAQEKASASHQQFLLTLFTSLISLAVAMFTMLYTRKKLFEPLIQAQQMIVELSKSHQREYVGGVDLTYKEAQTLNDAIYILKEMLQQRDVFEFKLKNMANTDSLTGVSNRVALDAFLNEYAAEPQLFQQLSLIVVDIDHFKSVNDQYGHILGDRVIAQIASCLQANIARSELIVRFGGDEFLIVLKNLKQDWLIQIAESILADISQLRFDLPGTDEQLKVSVSIGIASGAENWEALFSQADESLFKAKAQGRNKVVV
ncbi:GGDEF domain-containing protein [Acinetobacter sp. WCHAc060025]|uniref:GGDEF domain-containing protein n=1 Tax=Acinetobacter sp. WCHAc060025 TaxID=2518625 RepID=UPI0010235BFF|nr:GGDEF domain-containing protein [Acinetobacter sp. WCHAc060025]RZG78270.1 GGDEF domain-containing protein [Acinetobacter sp. WCHAc060025]